MIMVKPGISYLDIVKTAKDSYPELPLFIYQVSGEYSMLLNGQFHYFSNSQLNFQMIQFFRLISGAKAGIFDLKTVLTEVLVSMRRAGADCIISYFVPTLLEWMKSNNEGHL